MTEELRIIMQLCGKVEDLRREVADLREEVRSRNAVGQWYSAKEAAKIMRVSGRVMYKRLDEGIFPTARKEGKSWLIPAADVNNWIKGHTAV